MWSIDANALIQTAAMAFSHHMRTHEHVDAVEIDEFG